MIKNQLFSIIFALLILMNQVSTQEKGPETFEFTTEVTRYVLEKF